MVAMFQRASVAANKRVRFSRLTTSIMAAEGTADKGQSRRLSRVATSRLSTRFLHHVFQLQPGARSIRPVPPPVRNGRPSAACRARVKNDRRSEPAAMHPLGDELPLPAFYRDQGHPPG